MPVTPAAYRVLTESVDALGRRVLTAARSAEEIAARPARLPSGVTGCGSAELEAAVSVFAQTWSAECAVLAHDTRLLGDGLLAVAEHYRDVEWAAASMLSPVLATLAGAPDPRR